MKRISALLFTLIVAAGGVYFYFSQSLAPSSIPASVLATENALALPGTIAVASVDMAYVKRIDRTINGEDDPSPLLNPAASDDFLGILQEQGVNLVAQTDYAIATAGITEDSPHYAFVLLGNYSVAEIKQALRTKYMMTEDSQGYWLLQTENIRTCERSPAQAIDIQEDRILIASPDSIATLSERLDNQEAAGLDLTKWRAFRQDKVFAAAILVPKDTHKSAPDFMTKAMLKKAVDEQPLESIYAGAVVNILPPQGMKLMVDVQATEAAWAEEIESKYREWVKKTAHQLDALPTVSGLMTYMSVQADGHVLRAELVANKALIADLKNIPTELLGLMFSGARTSPANATAASAEKLISPDEVVAFEPRMSFANIPPVDTKDMFTKPDVTSGPFAIHINEIGLQAFNDSVVEFNMKVEGAGFSNLTTESFHIKESSNPAQLEILSVSDAEGHDLLKKETCGQLLNTDKVNLNVFPNKTYHNESGKWLIDSMKITGEKKLRLQEGIRFDQVAKIKGRISVEIATSTQTKIIRAPFAGKTIETDKVRVFFKDGGSSSVKYDISGQPHYVLAIRPQNAKGQYLASQGGSAMGGSITRSVQGEIAAIEVVYAQEMQSKDFDFAIDGLMPKFRDQGSTEAHTVQATTKDAFISAVAAYNYPPKNYMGINKDAQLVQAGPFMIRMNSIENKWGDRTGGSVHIYAPDSPSLEGNMSAIELTVDTLVTTDGLEKMFDASKKVTLTRSRVGSAKSPQYYLRSYENLSSEDPSLKGIKVKKAKGRVNVQLPKKLHILPLEGRQLGSKTQSEKGLHAKLAGFKNERIIIDLQGPVESIVQIRAKDAKDAVLPTSASLSEKRVNTWNMSKEQKSEIENQPQTWEAQVSVSALPETIEILYADSFDTIEYPFEYEFKTE